MLPAAHNNRDPTPTFVKLTQTNKPTTLTPPTPPPLSLLLVRTHVTPLLLFSHISRGVVLGTQHSICFPLPRPSRHPLRHGTTTAHALAHRTPPCRRGQAPGVEPHPAPTPRTPPAGASKTRGRRPGLAGKKRKEKKKDARKQKMAGKRKGKGIVYIYHRERIRTRRMEKRNGMYGRGPAAGYLLGRKKTATKYGSIYLRQQRRQQY